MKLFFYCLAKQKFHKPLMEPNESPLSTSPSSSNVSQTRHFYLAVDRPQFKMVNLPILQFLQPLFFILIGTEMKQETLVDLLGMAGRLCSIPIVVSCSTRDELDAVLSAVSSISHITMAALVLSQSFFLFVANWLKIKLLYPH